MGNNSQLGVKLSNLKYEAEQLSLFRDVQKRGDAIKAMDMVNDRYGEFSVTYGSLLSSEEKGSHVISPAWRPDGIRNVDVQ
jgi:DNA polymerase-4